MRVLAGRQVQLGVEVLRKKNRGQHKILLLLLISTILSACAKIPANPPAIPDIAEPTAAMTQAPSMNALEEKAITGAEKSDPSKAAAVLPSHTPNPPPGESHVTPAAQTPEEPVSSSTPAGTPTPDTRKLPKYWAEWPLLPTVSARAKEIFLRGQELGNDPHSFTTIGDCQSEPNILMGTYGTNNYQLKEGYAYLEETIQWFKDSFQRDSITVKDGMSAASVFAPGWADPAQCKANETPLECEFRLHKPVIVIISLGTNWKGGDEVKHAEYVRRIVDYAISQGVVPVLSSKGDNQEGGHRINGSMAQIAYDYDLPFWNFWLSIRDLPGKGIDGTRPGGYLIPDAWPRRSFTGLQALDAVWRELKPLVK